MFFADEEGHLSAEQSAHEEAVDKGEEEKEEKAVKAVKEKKEEKGEEQEEEGRFSGCCCT